jgi:hypothetical protein
LRRHWIAAIKYVSQTLVRQSKWRIQLNDLPAIVAKLVTRYAVVSRVQRTAGRCGWEYWCKTKAIARSLLRCSAIALFISLRSLDF